VLCLYCPLPQLLAQVSYLKAIGSTYQPVRALQPSTIRLLCHDARHKSIRDVLEGWAASSLRPIATFLQPLQPCHWSDSHPSGKDLERWLHAAAADHSSAVRARIKLLQGLPAAAEATHAAAAVPAAAPGGNSSSSSSSGGCPVRLHALNRFCWDTATRPHAAEAEQLAVRAALPPGTDMTPEDVAAAKAAAARAAEAAVAHALLLSTLPVWFAPTETGSCSGALQAAASLLPMPAYGLSLDLEAVGQHSSCDALVSLPALASRCVQQLLAVQQAGPYVLVGCGVFSCMLAAAMASELEHQLQQQQVVLVLLDGPPALPGSYEVPDPALYGLYQVLRDAGVLPSAVADGTGEPQAFAAFAADVSTGVQAVLSAAGDDSLSRHSSFSNAATAGGTAASSTVALLPPVPADKEEDMEAALLQVASELLGTQLVAPSAAATSRPAQAEPVLLAAVRDMLSCCRIVRRLCRSYTPEFVYQVPAVLLLTEDAAGQAFLEVARER